MKLTFTFLLAAVPMAMGQDTIRTQAQYGCPPDGHGACLVMPEKLRPEVGHCYRVTAVETFEEIACPETATTGPLKIVPFDVPPKETTEWEPPLPTTLKGDNSWCELTPGVDMSRDVCFAGVVHHHVHHRTCKDKSRFLLMSEDSRWHCLALGAKP